MLADFTSAPEVYLLLPGGKPPGGGESPGRVALRMCAGRHGDGTAGGIVGRRANGTPSDAPPASACDPLARLAGWPSESLRGNQRAVGEMIPVRVHSNCSEWVEVRYRVCADVSGGWAQEEDADGATDGWNFFYLNGGWFRQRFAADHAPGLVEGALFHFQVWKRAYKKQQGAVQLPRAGEGGVFVFTKEGFGPAHEADAGGRDVQGGSAEGVRDRTGEGDPYGEAFADIHTPLDNMW